MKTLTISCALLLLAVCAAAQSSQAKIPVNPIGKVSLLSTGKVSLASTKEIRRVHRLHETKMEARTLPHRDTETNSAKLSGSAAAVVEIKAFPNPFSSQIDIIITDGAMARSAYKASLYDINGRRVHGEALVANQSSLQLAHLDAGIYFLQIEKNGSLLKQEKFVKQ